MKLKWHKCGKLSIGLALVFCSVVGSHAVAEQQPLWATVSGWNVHVDTSLDQPGCFLAAVYEKGTLVRIGINPKTHNAYMIVANDKWESLEIGKKYELEITFEGETPWSGPANALMLSDTKVLMMVIDKPLFLKEFSTRDVMRVNYRDREVAAVKLTGSAEATEALIECQEKVNEIVAQASSDPFKENNDPFKTVRHDDPFR